MPSLDELNAEKQAALDIVDTQLVAAATLRNTGVPGMAAKVKALRAQRLALALQDYEDAMNAPALARAMAALKAATAAMTDAAARMDAATDVLTAVDDLIAAADQAEAALKGG